MTGKNGLPNVHQHDQKYLRSALPIVVSKLSGHQVNAAVLGLDTPEDTLSAYFGLYALVEQAAVLMSHSLDRPVGRCLSEMSIMASSDQVSGIEVELVLASHACHSVMAAVVDLPEGSPIDEVNQVRLRACLETVHWDDQVMIVGLAQLASEAVNTIASLADVQPGEILESLGLAVAHA